MTMPLTQTPPTQQQISERQRYKKRNEVLKQERSSWLSHWQELNDQILPRRMRYLATDRNKGTKRNQKIINNAPTRAARILGAGKMAGETSPARPWFRYIVTDPKAKKDPDALLWASDAESVVREAAARSNLYARLHELWFLQGVFATATMYIEEDDEDDIRCYILPIGRYCLASSGKGRIDTCYDEFSMTVEQLVNEFGKENVSPATRELLKAGKLDDWISVLHVIEPNTNRDTTKIDNWNMPFLSTWWEVNAGEEWAQPLRRSGYEEFPMVVARWDVIGEDIYGSGCPGMDALGDCQTLQRLATRHLEGVDKMVRPPMKAPVAAKAARLSLLPGDVSYVDETAQGAKFEQLIEVKGEALNAAVATSDGIVRRVMESFYAHLFEMMVLDDRQQPATAREINERHSEKMLMLGPVVERDEDEVLDPMHARILRILFRRGKLLALPKSLVGARVKVEYISIMAQAQKMLGTAATERFISFVGSSSAIRADVLDIPNFDVIIKKYAEKLGLAPDEINTDEAIKALRARREQEQQMAQQAAMAKTVVDGAKVASETDMGGDTALSRLLAAGGGAPGPLGRA